MPTGFAALIEVLRDPAVNVDALAYVEQCAVAIEKSVNATAAWQRIERLTCAREIDVLGCLGHRVTVSGSLRGGRYCSDSVALNRAGSSKRQTTKKTES
jgi:hypothetical protein